jgi:anti-sigma factor RsiW
MHPSLLILQEALDHRLEGGERIAVDEHLAGCEACRRQIHALRWTTIRLAGVGAGVTIPPALQVELRRLLSAPPDSPGSTPAPAPPPGGWRRWLGGWGR